ncbi:MAG: monothiol glutaredoxin, Grx4 family [Bdellovibrionaceae bacterium]|nr:monothiol glutaredoxin, Grx4 family [Pseudobdellovibrionaceae bacterium]
MNDQTKTKIESFISSKPVVLFMKGSPEFPMCGFSAKVVELLASTGMDRNQLASLDVLEDPEVREGIKEFSSWPTLPQLYVKGQFIGGCDIVMDLAEKGELSDLVSEFK